VNIYPLNCVANETVTLGEAVDRELSASGRAKSIMAFVTCQRRVGESIEGGEQRVFVHVR